MATKSLHFCRHRGCNILTPNAYCEQHQTEHEARQAQARSKHDKQRGTATERGYNADWRRARESWLYQHPLCVRCESQNRVTAATMVHHVQAIKRGGARLNSDNFMSLCFDCHEIVEGRRRG